MAETDDFQPREAGPDRRDNVTSAGLTPELWDRLEAYRVEHRQKRSDTTRNLIRQALDFNDLTRRIEDEIDTDENTTAVMRRLVETGLAYENGNLTPPLPRSVLAGMTMHITGVALLGAALAATERGIDLPGGDLIPLTGLFLIPASAVVFFAILAKRTFERPN